jgi:NADH dehydrogenase FAD-containing subunit
MLPSGELDTRRHVVILGSGFGYLNLCNGLTEVLVVSSLLRHSGEHA